MKITLLGYYGFGNFGDEWSLQAVVHSINELYPESEVTVISRDPSQTLRFHGLQAVDRSPRSIKQAIDQCDFLVCGGGSLLQDVTSWRSLVFYLAVIYYALSIGKKVVLWGQGIGPLTRGLSRLVVRKILNRVDLITLRDYNSYQLLSELGISTPPVVQAADPVFDYSFLKPPVQTEEPVLAVVLRSWPKQDLGQWLPPLAEAITAYAKEHELKIRFFPFQPQEDYLVQETLREILALEGMTLEICNSWQSIDELFESFCQCKHIIAQRYHALILAALADKPVLPLAYDPKVSALSEYLGLPALRPDDIRNPAFVWQVMERVFQKQQSGFREKVPKLQEAARLSASAFSQLVKRE